MQIVYLGLAIVGLLVLVACIANATKRTPMPPYMGRTTTDANTKDSDMAHGADDPRYGG